VKRNLLDLRPLYQFPDPIEQSLIGEPGRQTLVMRDLAVEFDTPVTHCIPPFFKQGETTSSSHFTTTERQICFNAPGPALLESDYCVSRPTKPNRASAA
jgi:hypothetical protein